MARFPRRAPQRLRAYWRAEARTLRQGLAALFVSSGGDLLAGLALAFMDDSLQRLPSLFLLIPAAIGMRGNIFGALGSRLSTGILAGEFEVSRDREGFLGQNVLGSVYLTLATSLFLGAAARGAAAAFGFTSISLWGFVAVSILGVALGVAIVVSTILALLTTAWVFLFVARLTSRPG